MMRTIEHRSSSTGAHTPYLTSAEIDVLAQLANGSTLDVAARRLDTSARTLRRRVRAACDRLSVDTPIEAVVWAVKNDLI